MKKQNFIKHMKKWGGQLNTRPPNQKNWGDVSLHLPQDRRPCRT